MKFSYRDKRISGRGPGRHQYIVDVGDPHVIGEFLCVLEGVPGDWKVHGVGPRDPNNPKRKFLGPYRTRDEAAQAYRDGTEP